MALKWHYRSAITGRYVSKASVIGLTLGVII